jgi:hypothetical protein
MSCICICHADMAICSLHDRRSAMQPADCEFVELCRGHIYILKLITSKMSTETYYSDI